MISVEKVAMQVIGQDFARSAGQAHGHVIIRSALLGQGRPSPELATLYVQADVWVQGRLQSTLFQIDADAGAMIYASRRLA
jgi:hypothetical protein